MKKIEFGVTKVGYMVDANSKGSWYPHFYMEFMPQGFPQTMEGKEEALKLLESLLDFPQNIKTKFYVEIQDED